MATRESEGPKYTSRPPARGSGARSVVVAVVALAAAVAAGLAVGVWWPSHPPSHAGNGGGNGSAEVDHAPAPADYGDGLAELVHRFTLSPLDMKETLESAALAVTDDGSVFVAWGTRTTPDAWRVYLVRSTDQGRTFSPPREVARSQVHRSESKSRGKRVTREMRILPRLAAGGNDLYLGWCEAVADNSTVNYFVSRSGDGGETFLSPLRVHGWAKSRPTYTGLTAAPDGRVAGSWLDNRRGVQLPAAAERRAENPLFSVEWNLYEFRDEGVCPCCPTSVALADDGSLLVAFRNEMNGYRDIWLARKEPGEEPPPLPVAVTPPRWKFDGCPHDGPSLRVVNDRFYLAFMDASSGKPRVYLTEGGFDLKGETPVEVSPRSDATQGHPCLVADAEAGLHLVWDEGMSSASHSAAPTDHDGHEHGEHEHDAASAGETARAIFYVQRSKEGELGTPRAVAPVKDTFQTRPAVAVSPAGDVYVAWTELSEEGRSIVVARLKEAR